MEFNRCQTPESGLGLDSCPLEVREQFWDFVGGVPFIRWMVGKDRPPVSELPRDADGRAVIDVTRPPILENTAFFRRGAAEFRQAGAYTRLRPNANPNSEFGRWLAEERRRCWEGYADPSTGLWITGDLYFFLNYCQIQVIKKDRSGKSIRVVDFPDFWDGHFLVTHYLREARESGRHAAELASRGKGKSFLGAALLAKRFILGESRDVRKRVQCVVTAADRKFIYGANQILNMFQSDIDFCAVNTQFASHRLVDSAQSLTWQMGYRDSLTGVRKGSENSVMGITSGDDQSKLNGSRGVLYLIEEAGIFRDLLGLYQMIRPSVEDGGSVFGLIFAYGTAGDEMSDFTAMQEIMYNPKGYNMLPLENVYDKEGQGRRDFTFFFPAYLNRAGCMDADGNSDVTKALKEILMDRYTVKYNSTDINAITKRVSQYPVTPQEAIIVTHRSIFPITELNERIGQIDNNPNEYDDVYVGELVQDGRTGAVEFRPTADLPIREFPTKDNKLAGALEIYSMPQKDGSGKVPPERYILSSDPFSTDGADTMSLGSVLVLDLWTDTIAAEYTGRPQYTDDYFEICRKLCLFYNGRLMYENNRKGTFSYFSQHGCLHLLADTPEYLRDRQLIKGIGYGNASKGILATAAIKDYGFRLIRDWLVKPVRRTERGDGGEEHEVSVPNLYRLRGRALLKELALWQPALNADRIMSLVQLMLYREEKMILWQGDMARASGRDTRKTLADDDYFARNYPQESPAPKSVL